MKILVLTNLYPPHYIGGYELICQTVVELLGARGHHIRILTSDYRTPACAGDLEADPRVTRVLRINGLYGNRWHGILDLRALESHNHTALQAALRTDPPDLVYVWNMGGLSKSMLFRLQASGLPIVFYVSDHWIMRGLRSDVWLNWWNGTEGSWKQRCFRRFWTWAGGRRRWDRIAPTHSPGQLRFDRIYFCSRTLRDQTAASGANVAHGAIIHPPIHDRYLQSAPRSVSAGLDRLLYVGRLTEEKGIGTALRALALVRKTSGLGLDVYGNGDADYVNSLRRLAEEQNLDVRFASAGLAEMPAVYRRHGVLLFTSEWDEPFALTPLEAMASGVAVIGTCTGGSAELFRHGENALTYRAGDAEELADRILTFGRDEALRQRCARTGCLEARERFAAPVIVDQIEQYLDESLGQVPTGALSGRSRAAMAASPV